MFPRALSCKRCRLGKTRREYWSAGLGPILAKRFESGLLDLPPYRYISSMNRELTGADGAGTMTKMVPTDDRGHIPATYGEFMEVFSKVLAETLPPYRSTDHAIDLEPGYTSSYRGFYTVSEFELRTLEAYIEANLANAFIQRSSSPAAAPILFAMNKDGQLGLCVDYRALNLATVNNRYPLPSTSEMLHRVREARIITKPDIRGANIFIRIKGAYECKTSFRTHYGRFEYWVMPFGLTMAPAMFQSWIDDCLRPYIDDFALCYLNNKLIHSTNEKEDEEHVCQVLQGLKEFRLYCKAEKCRLRVSEVGFLGFVVTSERVGMESDRISTIDDWLTPKSIRDVQVLLEFTNFSRRFIRNCGKVTLSPSELPKKTDKAGVPPKGKPRHQKSEDCGKVKWERTRQAELALRELKRTLTDAQILQHVNLAKPIILQRTRVDSQLRAFPISTMFLGFSGQSIPTPGSALQQNRITTLMIMSYWPLWKQQYSGGIISRAPITRS